MKSLTLLVAFFATVLANPSRRIFGGRDALVGEAPYMIQFRVVTPQFTDGHQHCGGSLVSAQSIISAAHCFQPFSLNRGIFATAAQHNWRVESPEEQTRVVARAFNHPDYSTSAAPFDISVVQVDQPFVLNNLVQPIALPPRDFIHSGNVRAFGWGVWNIPTHEVPDILQTTTKDIIPHESCRELLNAIFPGQNPLHSTCMCTGPLDGSSGICNADSGGPIVQTNPSNGVLELVGVVAWGSNPCDVVNFPSVFARVSGFLNFVNQHIV